MVKATGGFTILPWLTCQNLSGADANLLREFKGQTPVRDVVFVTGPHSVKLSVQKALVKTILSTVPKELRKDPKKSEILPIT
jgi:hypothetical protein